MSMYENVGMTSLDYMKEILQLRKALADVADECSKAYDKIAQLENPWISVKDRLPEQGAKVIVCLTLLTGERRIKIAKYYGRKFMDDTIEMCSYHEELVTHWMPLPELPEKPYQEWDRVKKEREEDAVH